MCWSLIAGKLRASYRRTGAALGAALHVDVGVSLSMKRLVIHEASPQRLLRPTSRSIEESIIGAGGVFEMKM